MERILIDSGNLESALERASELLASGGLILYPTETVYGVGVDATNAGAVTRLLSYKNRPAGKAISVLVRDRKSAEDFVEINETAHNLYETFLPGPVTIISKSRGRVDSRLESEFATLGIRISSHPIAAAIAEKFAKPVTSTSANASGKARPYSVDTALSGLTERQRELIDLILDYGELPKREPSTVVDTTQDVQQILRIGEEFDQLHEPYISNSEDETIAIGRQLMTGLLHAVSEKPVVFALEGEMGAGKTHFTKGIAAALEIEQHVTSPSYTLVKEYDAPEGHRLIHFDCWRLPEITPSDLGIDEYLVPGNVVVVEWAAPLLEYLATRTELVGYRLAFVPDGLTRRRIAIGAI